MRDVPICPVCGSDDMDWLLRIDGEIIGCDECVDFVDPNEYAADEEEEKQFIAADRAYDEWKER